MKQGATETVRGRKNEIVGEVISDKMDKTIRVRVFRLVKHRKYLKYIKRTSVFVAHDELNTAKTGDKVRLLESRPLSKTKRWKLSAVLNPNGQEVD